jgi:hypothetical protein
MHNEIGVVILSPILRNNPRVLSRGKQYLTGIPQVALQGKNIYYPLPNNSLENQSSSYNPFSYYENEVPAAIVVACVGSNTTTTFNKAAPVHFHTLFASLHQENVSNFSGILEWIRHFGIPRKSLQQYAEKRAKKFNGGVFIPIDYIIRDIDLFSFALKINSHRQSLLINRDDLVAKAELSSLLIHDLHSKSPFVVYNDFVLSELLTAVKNKTLSKDDATHHYQIYTKFLEERIEKNPSHYASKALCFLIDLSAIHPEYDMSRQKEPVITWRAEDPLSAMWGMLAFDTKESRLLRQCIAPGCFRFFEAKRPSRKYCSDLCKNRAKVHRFRHQ